MYQQGSNAQIALRKPIRRGCDATSTCACVKRGVSEWVSVSVCASMCVLDNVSCVSVSVEYFYVWFATLHPKNPRDQ
jgi:hypothetical protein